MPTNLLNSSSSSIDLANLKIRYYYTIDSSATQNF
ncbi:cellulose binding domain-containing protein [Pseudobacteroides sp.]